MKKYSQLERDIAVAAFQAERSKTQDYKIEAWTFAALYLHPVAVALRLKGRSAFHICNALTSSKVEVNDEMYDAVRKVLNDNTNQKQKNTTVTFPQEVTMQVIKDTIGHFTQCSVDVRVEKNNTVLSACDENGKILNYIINADGLLVGFSTSHVRKRISSCQ